MYYKEVPYLVKYKDQFIKEYTIVYVFVGMKDEAIISMREVRDGCHSK